MRFYHHDFQFEVDDEWWTAAGMEHWRPSSRSYRVDLHKFTGVREVSIYDVAPVRRKLSHGVFNDDAETGLRARDRVIRLLTGFKEERPIPPVEVIENQISDEHKYHLFHGAHRFYLSLAAGFTHIPAV